MPNYTPKMKNSIIPDEKLNFSSRLHISEDNKVQQNDMVEDPIGQKSVMQSMPSGKYLDLFDDKRVWQVGAVIFHDTRAKHFGMISKRDLIHHRSDALHFPSSSVKSESGVNTENLVVFTRTPKDGSRPSGRPTAAEVYLIKDVRNLPWTHILEHVGSDMNLVFDSKVRVSSPNYGHIRTEHKKITISLIKTVIQDLSIEEQTQMVDALRDKLTSFKQENERLNYLLDVLNAGLFTYFVENYSIEQIQRFSIPFLFDSVFALAIENKEQALINRFLASVNLSEINSTPLKALLNKEANDWKSINTLTTALAEINKSTPIIEWLKTSSNDFQIDARAAFELSARLNDSWFIQRDPVLEESIVTWLRQISNQSFIDYFQFFGSLDSRFKEVFRKELLEKRNCKLLLTSGDETKKSVLEVLLTDKETVEDKEYLSSLLSGTSLSQVIQLFDSYSEYPMSFKNPLWSALIQKKPAASDLLLVKEGKEKSIAMLFSEEFDANKLPDNLFDFSALNANYDQLVQLQSFGILKSISDQAVSECINNETSEDGQLQILLRLTPDTIDRLLEGNLLGSDAKRLWIMHEWNRITRLNYIVFDLESSGSTISEAAAVGQNVCVSILGDKELSKVTTALSSAQILVGHNIKKWDIPILANRGFEVKPEQYVWDTLEMEMVLNPHRYSYALQTAHSAEEDSIFCEELFWNQLYRISNNRSLISLLESVIPEQVMEFVDTISLPKFQDIFKEQAHINKAFFRTGFSLDEKLAKKLDAISKESESSKILILAPNDLWPALAGYFMASFPTATDYQYKCLSQKKVMEFSPKSVFTTAILNNFICGEKAPQVINLPKALRKILPDSELSLWVEEEDPNTNIVCTDSFGVDKLGNVNDFSVIYCIGYELESRMNKLPLGEAFHAADLFQSESGTKLVMQLSGGAAFIPLDKETYQKLGLPDLPEDTQNLWMNKNAKNEYQVYCNRNFSEFLDKLTKRYPLIRFERIDWVYSDSCSLNISLVATENNPRYDSMMKRVNSTSSYRSMYWVYQFQFIERIESRHIKALLVDNSDEIPQIVKYAESKGFYVPASDITVQRRIELCESSTRKPLLVLSQRDFEVLRTANIEIPVCLIWDNLGTDSLQVMWKGLLPFGDEEKYSAEIETSCLSCLLAAWPMVKYYYYQMARQSDQTEFYLLDPSLDDYRELERSLKVTRRKYTLWQSEESYQIDLKNAQEFFLGKKREEDLDIDFEQAKDTIRRIFLDHKAKNGIAKWTSIQEKALPEIFKREKHCLVSIPTGGGKSVLFQGAALYRAAFTNRLSIVVTPLKALMQDQVDGLLKLGFVTNVDYLNSDKSRPEVNRIYRKINGGELALLYVTPERFRSRGFMNALLSRLTVDGGLEYIIFDEAHCISQWGLDFRPEYLSTARKCEELVQQFNDVPIELFSATVTGQVLDDIERIISPIQSIGTEESYNPIRNHIKMEFCITQDSLDERVSSLYKQIKALNFNPERSRILVFSRTRKDSVLAAELLQMKFERSNDADLLSCSDRIGYFHAGMDAEDRTDAYEKFQNGEYVILVATKAFGMGMDISNIHYVFHLQPPQFLEDYLQEVGRAGRNKDQYLEAGFSEDNPIPTVCFLSKEDFKNLKTLLMRSMLSWQDIRAVYSAVSHYVLRFQPKETDKSIPVAVPDNIAVFSTGETEAMNTTKFRLSQYWLERLGRIKLGYYSPTTIEVSLPDNRRSESLIKDDKLLALYRYVLNRAEGTGNSSLFQLYINDVCSSLSIGQNTLFNKIIEARRLGLFKLESRTCFEPTKLRHDEMRFCADNHMPFYVLKAIFGTIRILLSEMNERQVMMVDLDKRNLLLNQAILELGLPDEDTLPWYSSGAKGLSRRKSYIDDLRNRRAKYIFDIMDSVTDVKVKSRLNHNTNQLIQEIYLSSSKWATSLDSMEADCNRLLTHLIRLSDKNAKDFVWSDVIVELGLPEDYQYFSNLIRIIRVLGFINVGNLLSTGIEVSLTNDQREICDIPKEGEDKTVYDSFLKVQRNKEIKAAVMDTFADRNSVAVNQYDSFIKQYFKCETETDFMALLSAYNNEDNERMSALRKEAIKKQEERLDLQQQAIYEMSIDQDINVIAGPGSGKTFVLTLRCAKLVYHHQIPPQNILVLAYNRAVVEELKIRLSRLFNELGYGRSLSRLQIYTFHGLAKKYCYDLVKDEPDIDAWEGIFLNYVKTNPGRLKADMGNIQYVLIDEFQDITSVRLSLMQEIRKLFKNPKFFTIGDINQSIYGFDKAKRGEPMNPEYYYDKLRATIKPIEMGMTTNYRSYQGILDAAMSFIPSCPPSLQSVSERVSPERQFVFIIDGGFWFRDFPSKLDYFKQINSDEHTKDADKIRTVALFFRGNNEVYRGYAKVREMNLSGVRIRVQGSSCEFFRRRECNALIDYLQNRGEEEINEGKAIEILSYLESLYQQHPNWEQYSLDLVYSLALEYLSSKEEDSTCLDFADYLLDVGSRDDGQIAKIYERNKSRLPHTVDDNQIEIVLTTMHKVKGLEFDAVFVTPSFHSLACDDSGIIETNAIELLSEEKRLYYVAYTRAKNYLCAYRHKREKAVEEGQTYHPEEELRKKLGVPIKEDIKNVFINYSAEHDNVNNYLETTVRKNDEIILEKSGNVWYVKHINPMTGRLYTIGQISSSICGSLNELAKTRLSGLFINDVLAWTYDETLRAEQRQQAQYHYQPTSQRRFSENWTEDAIKRGYIYLPSFAGYVH